jgi:hypothetical protein
MKSCVKLPSPRPSSLGEARFETLSIDDSSIQEPEVMICYSFGEDR